MSIRPLRCSTPCRISGSSAGCLTLSSYWLRSGVSLYGTSSARSGWTSIWACRISCDLGVGKGRAETPDCSYSTCMLLTLFHINKLEELAVARSYSLLAGASPTASPKPVTTTELLADPGTKQHLLLCLSLDKQAVWLEQQRCRRATAQLSRSSTRIPGMLGARLGCCPAPASSSSISDKLKWRSQAGAICAVYQCTVRLHLTAVHCFQAERSIAWT